MDGFVNDKWQKSALFLCCSWITYMHCVRTVPYFYQAGRCKQKVNLKEWYSYMYLNYWCNLSFIFNILSLLYYLFFRFSSEIFCWACSAGKVEANCVWYFFEIVNCNWNFVLSQSAELTRLAFILQLYKTDIIVQFPSLNTVCGRPVAFRWRVGDFSSPCCVLIQCSLSVSYLELQNCLTF